MAHPIDEINLRTMRSKGAAETYAVGEQLQPREQAALDSVFDAVWEQPILDLGVGAGRTVKPLLAVSSDYLGIDYSPEMIAACRQRYAEQRFEYGDARHLTSVRDESIGLVMFSCNGICMVGHEDRLRILREAHRVLTPGGVLILTTYNQRCTDERGGFKFPRFYFSRNPIRLGVRIARFLGSTVVRAYNRQRYQRHNVRTAEYSMINDECHDYGTMLYYITLAQQRRQLEACGFMPNAAAYDQAGEHMLAENTENDYALVARKPAGQVTSRRQTAAELRVTSAANALP